MKPSSFWLPVLFLLCAAAAWPQRGGIQLSLVPGVAVPVAGSRELFRFGGSTLLQMDYTFPFSSLFFVRASAGYAGFATTAQTYLSTVPVAAGVGIRLSPLARFSLRSAFTGGGYLGIYHSLPAGNPCFSADLECAYLLSPSLELGVGATYQYFAARPEPLFQGLGFSAAFRYGIGGSRPKLQIRDVQLQPVFPVFYQYYDDHPLGRVVLKNTASSPVQDIVVSLFVPQYMDKPKVCLRLEELPAGRQEPAALFALFNDKVFQLTEGTKTSAEIRVECTFAGQRSEYTQAQTVRMHYRNALCWDDDRKVAAFVTAKAPAIMQYSRQMAGVVRAVPLRAVDERFCLAMATFESLSLHGLSYAADPNTPYERYSRDDLALDYLQFPEETLAYKAGDCDDLTVLYNALLESAGVETAFVTVPGHIFAAFALTLPPGQARGQLPGGEGLIERDGRAWIPVEVTMVRDGFFGAWQTGVQQWNEHQRAGEAGFFQCRDAWREFEPAENPAAAADISLPAIQLLRERYAAALERFIRSTIGRRVNELQVRIDKGEERQANQNRLGVLYARHGLYEEAAAAFQGLVEGRYAPALINLGYLCLLRGDVQGALRNYRLGSEANPGSRQALLGLLRSCVQAGDFELAQQVQARLARLAGAPTPVSRPPGEAGPEARSAAAGEELAWEE